VIAAGLKKFISSFSGQDVSSPEMRDKMDKWNQLESELNKRGYTIQQLTGDTSGTGSGFDPTTPGGQISQIALDLSRVAQAVFGSASLVNIDRAISLVKRIKRISDADESLIANARAVRSTMG